MRFELGPLRALESASAEALLLSLRRAGRRLDCTRARLAEQSRMSARASSMLVKRGMVILLS